MSVVDASVIVSWTVPDDANFTSAQAWVESSRSRRDRWNVPSIILPEVAAAVSRALGDSQLAKMLLAEFLNLEEVAIFPVTDTLANSAATLAADLSIRGCDATYVALAAQLGEALVTFDRQQSDRARGTVEVLVPE